MGRRLDLQCLADPSNLLGMSILSMASCVLLISAAMLATAVSTLRHLSGGAPSSLQSFSAPQGREPSWSSPVPPPECGGSRLFEAKGERSDALQFFADGVLPPAYIAASSSSSPLVRAVILPPPGWRRWRPGFRGASCDLGRPALYWRPRC
ncbi:hypothetical protein EVAR_48883_1 [Eumeta japonica]|uniref:Uncharacterized protein n=1 Tax=Eumeta variegata TaxID=151549 RepID=A0A4C1YW22_EUMVA|nr:hypothetical protein EVAR_48883_1 [Eumeta japonica]